MKSKVSVIIPYYNDGRYIAETLYSIKQQSYPNIEVILVDDGSNDTRSIQIYKAIQLDNGEKFWQSNSGPSAARNFAITQATGKYILPLDADDKIESSYIEKAVEILEADSRCGIVYCKGALFGNDGGIWSLPPYSIGRMLVSNVIFNSGLFRKADWKLCGGYDEKLRSGIEDWDFWLSILSLGRKVYQIPEVLFYYRIKQSSRNRQFDKQMELARSTYFTIQNKHRDLYSKFFNEYLDASRNELLNQQFELQRLKQKQLKTRVGKCFPVLRRLWHEWKYK
ncbi:glycosyltransferase family A protein [uncultured Megasphaera sp.]|uniref:glycosyltransferase family A protein n=1 Tax=uncultured Megasphaera sp. TaxID=165188 RepID=UPI00262EED38|nr:glycosyltransferase family A protein [uncultured Megasphaera sp.]